MKRSQAVSLVLLAGAGATAIGLGWLDPTQREEDALIYRSESECVEAKLRSAEDCRTAATDAGRQYAATAPRYEDRSTCERHHGWGNCREAARLAGNPAGANAYMPFMVAYLMGRRAEQRLPTQPLYNHQPAPEEQQQTYASSHGGGYCTGAGGRVYAARSGGVSQVSSSVARTTTATPRVISRGGLGFTGQGVARASLASAGHGGFHGTSGS